LVNPETVAVGSALPRFARGLESGDARFCPIADPYAFLLGRSLGSMLIPVVIYSLVLSCMGISAVGTPLAGLGALLFIASDAMIAISKFRGSFVGNEQLIWITYYPAQLLILRGVQRRYSGNQLIPQSQSQ